MSDADIDKHLEDSLLPPRKKEERLEALQVCMKADSHLGKNASNTAQL